MAVIIAEAILIEINCNYILMIFCYRRFSSILKGVCENLDGNKCAGYIFIDENFHSINSDNQIRVICANFHPRYFSRDSQICRSIRNNKLISIRIKRLKIYISHFIPFTKKLIIITNKTCIIILGWGGFESNFLFIGI